jgi:autotransporter-associated beta strand protein
MLTMTPTPYLQTRILTGNRIAAVASHAAAGLKRACLGRFAWPRLLAGIAVAAALALAQPAPAATIIKADNADNLNLTTSWTGLVAPTASDIAKWDVTVTTPNTVALGGDLSWKGIAIANPSGPVAIGAGNTLTLGSSGIDMSAATQGLTISSGLTLLGGVNQVWNSGAGQTLTLDTGTFTRNAGATLNIQGSVATANINNDVTGIVGPWASYGTGGAAYAALNGGYLTSFVGTSAADATAVTDTTGAINYDVYGGGALGAGASFNTLRYLGAAGTLSGNFTAKGLMNAGSATLTISGGVTIGANRELVVSANSGIILTGVIANNGAGASSLVKTGSGLLTIGGGSAVVNTYSGGTWVNQGTLTLKDGVGSSALGSGDIFLANGTQLIMRPTTSLPNNNITVAGSSVFSLQGTSLTMNGLLTLSGNASTTIGNTANLAYNFNGGVNLNSFTFTTGAGCATAAQNYTINGAITGTGGLTFSASSLTSGTLTLSLGAANSFSGDTLLSVKAGATGTATLKLNHVNALQNSTLDTGASGPQRVTFVVAGDNTYNLGGLKGADDLAIGGNSLNVGANGASTTYSGVISSTGGGLVKSGAGTLTLSGVNTYTGSTTISNGVLALSGSGDIAPAVIYNYGTFDVSAVGGYHLTTGKTLQVAGSVIGPMTVDPNATLTVGGNSGTTGVGTMAITGDLTLSGNTVLRINKGGTSDRITATGTLLLGGTVNLNVVGAALAPNDQFQIFSAGNSGTPSVTGNPGSGLEWNTSLLNSDGIIKVVASANPPVISVALTNQTVECGANATFYALATGTAPLVYTWKVNGLPVASGTDLTSYTTNNVHSAGSSYTVSVQVTNLVSSANSSCTLSVADTLGPVITLAGNNPMAVVVGQPFIDPGAAAMDSCGGAITPRVTGSVDNNTVASYTLTYTAGDGNGNTNTATRTVNVVVYQNGIWTNTAGGLWMNGANWTDGAVALGPDATANFNQINITADPTLVHLDQPLSIGSMIFGDTSGSQTWKLDNNGDAANILTLASSGSPTITVNKETSISLQLAGTSGLTKDGTATLNLSASNSYSGGTLISAGSVRLYASVNSMLGLGDVTIADGARLWDNNGNGDKTFSNNFNIAGNGDGTGAIYLNSGKSLILLGRLTLNGPTKIGCANTAANAFIANGPVDLGSYTLTLRGATGTGTINTAWAINGPITGSGGLDWGAAGSTASTLTLSGTNNYTGVTTIGAVLSITTTNALPGWDAGNAYSVANGATLAVGNSVSDDSITTMLGTGNFALGAALGFNTGGGARTCALNLANTTAGALGLTKIGNNTLTLSGVNTYTGTTKVNTGVLSIQATTALPGWDTDGGYSIASGSTLAVGNGVSDANVASILATTNFVAGARIGFDTSAGDRTYVNTLANTVNGSLGLTKIGNNRLTLSGVNTYSGATVVSAGTLAINGTNGAGTLTVANNGTLAGSGLINGAATVQAGGTLAPGTSVGTLSISNSLTLAASSTTLMEISKSPLSNDLLRLSGALNYGGTLSVTSLGGTLAAGDSFKLFDAATYNGDFSATNFPSLPGNLAWIWTATNGTLSIVSAEVSRPVISSVTLSGTDLVLSGANGAPNGIYTVLASTNVALAVANWTPILTNTFGGSGQFTISIPVTNNVPKDFYLIKQ